MEWYEESFREDYLKIYAHRDEDQAEQELTSLLPYLPIKPGQRVLDLCCGQGRHSRWLAQQGLRVIGVDLSPVLLQEAIKKTLNMDVQYMRGDVRKIPFFEEMDLVVNLFTSFGYFTHDEENEKVLTKVSQALKPNGTFLFDYLNPAYLKDHLVPFTEHNQEDLNILQYRTINDEFVEKTIVIKEEGRERQYKEQVKLYRSEQLLRMLQRNHLEVVHLFGNYDGADYIEGSSPRMIFICRKKQ
jgi:SAM-dependent methyltransferase